jgi:glutathione S-transferase
MSPNGLKLYESSASPNSRRIRIFLAEKGICVTRVPVDLGAKEQVSEAYATINARRVVPTLVIDDGTAASRRWYDTVAARASVAA